MMLLSVDFSNLHTILETLYDEMFPLCEGMMDVGKGIAGLGPCSMWRCACGSLLPVPSRWTCTRC